MSEDEIYVGLNELFNDVFMRDDIDLKPSTTAADVDGWDSFKQIEIVISVEEKYDIKFSTKDLDNLKTVGDLVALISGKI